MKTIVIDGIIGFPKDWDKVKNQPNAMEALKDYRVTQIKDIVNFKGKDLDVNISSVGGDVNHAIQIRNALSNNQAKIKTEYTGWSASAATIIGSVGTVSAAENIMILPHEARGAAVGVQENIEAYGKMLDKTNDIIAQMYSDKTGKDKDEMRALMALNNGEGEWLTANEAGEYGLIDNVYKPMAIAASFSPEAIGLPGIPEEKLSILNVINMGIFKKKEEKLPLNKIQLGEVELVYEGDLKANTELMPLNAAELENGEYTLGDKTLVVKDLMVEEIVEEEPEAVIEAAKEEVEVKNQEIEALQESNTNLTTKLEDLEAKYETLTAQFGEIKSTHKTPEKSEVPEQKNDLPLNLQIKKTVKEKIDSLPINNKEE